MTLRSRSCPTCRSIGPARDGCQDLWHVEIRTSGSTTDEAAEAVLIAHQRHRGGCLCGWSELGRSHPGHQVAMLREAGLLGDAPADNAP